MVYTSLEVRFPAFTWQPAMLRYAQKAAELHLAKVVPDPELRAKVTPTYTMGCKRILLSNHYYPALGRDNVDVVTDRIAKITGDAVVTRDGVERPVDVLVVATGFHAAEQPIAHQVTGPDGRTLAEAWSGTGMRAYRGTTVTGFPNFFMVPGPNTGLGHTSMVFMIECGGQPTCATRSAPCAGQDLAVVEVDEADDAAYQRRLQRRMARTVWSTGGCSSWYVDEHGHNTTLWPRSTLTYRRLTRSFDAESYRTVPVSATDETRTEVPA